MTRRSAKHTHSAIPMGLPYRCAITVASTLCIGLILLLLSTAIAYAQSDPAVLARSLALASLYVSSVIGGYISAKNADRPLLCAAICGAGTMVLLMLLSFIPFGKSDISPSPILTLGMYAGVAAASLAGACLRLKTPKKRTARHKTRRRK